MAYSTLSALPALTSIPGLAKYGLARVEGVCTASAWLLPMPLGKLLLADTACAYEQLLVQPKRAAALAMSISSLHVPYGGCSYARTCLWQIACLLAADPL